MSVMFAEKGKHWMEPFLCAPGFKSLWKDSGLERPTADEQEQLPVILPRRKVCKCPFPPSYGYGQIRESQVAWSRILASSQPISHIGVTIPVWEMTSQNLCYNHFGQPRVVYSKLSAKCTIPAPPAAAWVLRCISSSFPFSALLVTGERRIWADLMRRRRFRTLVKTRASPSNDLAPSVASASVSVDTGKNPVLRVRTLYRHRHFMPQTNFCGWEYKVADYV